MNSTELKIQIENLRFMLLEPKLIITRYFESLINQLDVKTTKFEIAQTQKNDDTKKVLSEVNNWRQIIVERLEKAESELLKKIIPDFKLNSDMTVEVEKIIKTFIDENEQVHSLVSYKDLEQNIEEYYFQMQRDIMRNECFMVLNNQLACNATNINIHSFDLWREIMPIIHIDGDFIGRRGQRLLEFVIFF